MGVIIIILLLNLAIMGVFCVGLVRAATDFQLPSEREILFGKPVQIYEDVCLLVDKRLGPHESFAYDFSEYESRNIVGMTYWGPDVEEKIGIIPKISLTRYEDGTVLLSDGLEFK